MATTTKTITVNSQQIAEKATAIVNGNTVKLDYHYTQGKNAKAVNFSVLKGLENASDFTGQQTAGGSLQEDGSFSTYNIGQRLSGTGALLDEVYLICEQILKGTITKE